MLDGIEWIYERAENVAGDTGGVASHDVSRRTTGSPATTTNNGTTAKAANTPRDDLKKNVLPTPSSAAPSKATTPSKRQIQSSAGAHPPNVSTLTPNPILVPPVLAPVPSMNFLIDLPTNFP